MQYRHPFDSTIGFGNLKEQYQNGDYGFDPLQLMPVEPKERRIAQEMELNHCRLAMIAFLGIVVQEYATGQPISYVSAGLAKDFSILEIAVIPIEALQRFLSIPAYIIRQWSLPDFSSTPLKPPIV